MRYDADMEASLIEQIRESPTSAVILPDWAYTEGRKQPYVTVYDQRTPLLRRLYSVMIEPVPAGRNVINPTGVNQRNVNPYLARAMLNNINRSACRSGHEYDDKLDFVPRFGYRCHICRAEYLAAQGEKKTGNKYKTHCPQGHPYSRKNTMKLASGRRRCRICHKEQVDRWRANKKLTQVLDM